MSDGLKGMAELVEQATGVRLEMLKGRSRQRYIVDARTILCQMAHELGYSSMELGRFLNRDHTTILNLLKREVL